MGLSLQDQKALENHKGTWGMVQNLQKIGFDVIILVIRTMIFISGGAMIGILTFIGNLWTKNDAAAQKAAVSVGSGLFWFGLALSFSLLSALGAWATSVAFAKTLATKFFLGQQTKWESWQWPAYWAMAFLSLLSVLSFMGGMYRTFEGLAK